MLALKTTMSTIEGQKQDSCSRRTATSAIEGLLVQESQEDSEEARLKASHERHVLALKRKITKLQESQEDQLCDDMDASWCKALKKKPHITSQSQGPKDLDACMDWFVWNYASLKFHSKSHGIDYARNLTKNIGRPQQPLVQLIYRK